MADRPRRFRNFLLTACNEIAFRHLSDDAELALYRLSFSPHMHAMGVLRTSPGALCDEWGWERARVLAALDELRGGGWLDYDAPACCLALVPVRDDGLGYLEHNPPHNRNMIRGWERGLELIPRCEVQARHFSAVDGLVRATKPELVDELQAVFHAAGFTIGGTVPGTVPGQKEEGGSRKGSPPTPPRGGRAGPVQHQLSLEGGDAPELEWIRGVGDVPRDDVERILDYRDEGLRTLRAVQGQAFFAPPRADTRRHKPRRDAAQIRAFLGTERAAWAARNLALSVHHIGGNETGDEYLKLEYVARDPPRFLRLLEGDVDAATLAARVAERWRLALLRRRPMEDADPHGLRAPGVDLPAPSLPSMSVEDTIRSLAEQVPEPYGEISAAVLELLEADLPDEDPIGELEGRLLGLSSRLVDLAIASLDTRGVSWLDETMTRVSANLERRTPPELVPAMKRHALERAVRERFALPHLSLRSECLPAN